VVNFRIMHGIYTSGLRYIQYERFAKATGIGCLPYSFLNEMQELDCAKTEEIALECIREAVDEEVALTMLEYDENQTEYNGITILSDARHGWRKKNTRHSDVIPLGLKTHKVVGSVVVTKNDDNYSQRHELFGVKKLYEHFDGCDVNVNIHGHDRNMAVNKYLKVDQPHVTNTNDIWHVTKGINREIKKFVMVQRNITVFSGMVNSVTKLLPLKLSYYAMKNCEGSAERLKFLLDNILHHYQNVQTNCLDTK